MSEKKDTTLVAQGSGFLQFADLDFSQVVAEELDGLDITFDRVKMPSSGSTVFEIPSAGPSGDEDGECIPVKDFKGVILYHHPLLMYYKEKYTGGNNPPDCGSYDSVTGQGDPGGNCRTCPYNQFGSGENGGKACKSRRRLYILREGEIFPLLLHLPPGSLRELTQYLKRLLTKGKRSNMVVTRFSLQKATNKGNMVYSQAQFAADRLLTAEEQTVIARLSDQIKAQSLHVAIDDDPLSDAGQDNPFVDPETGEIIPQ